MRRKQSLPVIGKLPGGKMSPFSIDIDIDDNVPNNVYRWYKDGALVRTTSTNVFELANVQSDDAGIYTCVITNTDVPGIEIVWEKLTLTAVARPWQPCLYLYTAHVIDPPIDQIGVMRPGLQDPAAAASPTNHAKEFLTPSCLMPFLSPLTY